jgi:hypothetical protein
MNTIYRIRHPATLLAGLAAALACYATATPAAFAMEAPPPGAGDPGTQPGLTPVQTVTAGGMPGWQITLIAIGAALLAATLAVVLDRLRAARRAQVTTSIG